MGYSTERKSHSVVVFVLFPIKEILVQACRRNDKNVFVSNIFLREIAPLLSFSDKGYREYRDYIPYPNNIRTKGSCKHVDMFVRTRFRANVCTDLNTFTHIHV